MAFSTGNVATTAQENLLEDGGMYGNAKERKEKDKEQAKVALVCKGGGGVQEGRRGGDGVVAVGGRWGGKAGGSLLGGHLRQVEVLP